MGGSSKALSVDNGTKLPEYVGAARSARLYVYDEQRLYKLP